MKFPGAYTGEQARYGFNRRNGVEECGKQPIPFTPPEFNRAPRIRNGTCAPYGAIPWTAQIQILRNGRYEHQCGGAIISEHHIITARHCFGSEKDIKRMRVIVGQNNIDEMEEKEMAFNIRKVHLHKKYQTDGPHSYDLALIHIEPKGDGVGIRFSNEVQQICLPDEYDSVPDGLNCIISGWGRIMR